MRPAGSLLASRLSRVEVLVKPMRLRDEARTARFRGFFDSREVDLVGVSNEIVERALDLRVRTNLKLVDALHVATAVEHRATLFLTGDKEICALGRLETVSFELMRLRGQQRRRHGPSVRAAALRK